MPASDKLKDDPIVEAILEVRFTAQGLLPEVVVGRLSDLDVWRGTRQVRLPTADIPEPVRKVNPNLVHLPTVEIQNVAGNGAARIGGNVLSLHFKHPYQGWEVIYPILKPVVEAAYRTLPGLTAEHLSLRYLNVFTEIRHHVKSIADLAVAIEVAKETVTGPVSLAFSVEDQNCKCMTRLASKQFLAGQIPPDTAIAVDIQVSTLNNFIGSSADAVNAWVDQAHTREKQAFRRLLTDDLYSKLRE